MEISRTTFEGLFIIKTYFAKDKRGIFNKVYNKNFYKKHNLNTNFEELFYSESQKNVIRGMHFQTPPFEHEKLVFVLKGSVIDVVLDIRKNSDKYGNFFELKMSSNEGMAIYIPKGFAHGFKSLEDETIICYLTTKVYDSKHDSGIRYDSFGYDWQLKNPIVSDKDKKLIVFDEFKSPF